uniref:Uncharacterized protein n=1 Tax=Heterosigma akashiwo TaxID=2829 RepID=A0A7S4D538_HETAK
MRLVLRTEPAPLLALKVEVRPLAAPSLLAPPSVLHSHHVLQLVLATEPAPVLPLKVEKGVFVASSLLALLARHIHHALQLVLRTAKATSSLTAPAVPAPRDLPIIHRALGLVACLVYSIHHFNDQILDLVLYLMSTLLPILSCVAYRRTFLIPCCIRRVFSSLHPLIFFPPTMLKQL